MKLTRIFPAFAVALLCLLFVFPAYSASREEIDARTEEALKEFYAHTSAGQELAQKAAGMLVFPSVVKAGIGIGGEYGEGKLLVGGVTVAYYNIAGASIGFQLGAQVRRVIVIFLTEDALRSFQASEGWKAGVDGSVAIATVGAGGEIDSNTLQQPVIGFVFSNRGLMYNLTLEGSKITRIQR